MVQRIVLGSQKPIESVNHLSFSQVIVLTAVSSYFAYHFLEPEAVHQPDAPFSLLSAFGLFLTLLFVVFGRQQHLDKGIAISFYAIGVQLSPVLLSQTKDRSVVAQTKPRFIPKSEIIDCAVAEIVLAHQVYSTLVLRLRNDKTIPVFPGAKLSYQECMSLRSQVNSYLNQVGPKTTL